MNSGTVSHQQINMLAKELGLASSSVIWAKTKDDQHYSMAEHAINVSILIEEGGADRLDKRHSLAALIQCASITVDNVPIDQQSDTDRRASLRENLLDLLDLDRLSDEIVARSRATIIAAEQFLINGWGECPADRTVVEWTKMFRFMTPRDAETKFIERFNKLKRTHARWKDEPDPEF